MLAPPNLPPDRTRILREAFLKTFSEPEVLAEAKSNRLEIQTLTGEEVQMQMREALNRWRQVVERIKKQGSKAFRMRGFMEKSFPIWECAFDFTRVCRRSDRR
jgi:hypothetical protein